MAAARGVDLNWLCLVSCANLYTEATELNATVRSRAVYADYVVFVCWGVPRVGSAYVQCVRCTCSVWGLYSNVEGSMLNPDFRTVVLTNFVYWGAGPSVCER